VRRQLPGRQDLAYFIPDADAEGYWGHLWAGTLSEERLAAKLSRRQRLSVESLITGCFLKPHAGRILEGGCGNGRVLSQLALRGYDATGVDSSLVTVEMLQRCAGHLTVLTADVRSLPFADGDFAAYWSIGVIEHFEEGYLAVLREANRVLKPDGVFFISFPFMNALRRSRVRRHYYGSLDSNHPPGRFFQYALNPPTVIGHLREAGFTVCAKIPQGFLTGCADELPRIAPAIRRLDRARSRTGFTSAAYVAGDTALSLLAGRVLSHSLLIIAKKTGPCTSSASTGRTHSPGAAPRTSSSET